MISAMPEDLTEKAFAMKERNARLIQICCTKTDGFEITYSFDIEGVMENIRLHIPADQEIESVSPIFAPAFLYENEIKDLYGVKIRNITVDFHGNFYKLSAPAPFNSAPEGEA